jgi:prolyl-tRNA synthetase
MTLPAMLDVSAMPAAEPLTGPRPAPAAGGVDWRPAVDRPIPAGQTEPVSLGTFTSWLQRTGILDPQAIELPGSAVLLPPGVALFRQVEQIVRHRYADAGYAEYDFPDLVPPSALEPTRRLLKLDNRLLLAGADEDWAAGVPRAVLSPTGESSVYTFWAGRVRSRRDLPQRIFRHARYYRPAPSGRSILRGIESRGVLEFHACHPDPAANTKEFWRAVDMCRQACADVHVPALFSLRPPWTNNGSVADACIGIDVPLPNHATLQVGCVYDQADRFSQHYRVRWRENGRRHETWHVAGCLTRRLTFAHLFLGMDTAGELLVHPVVAPVQIGLTLHASGPTLHQKARCLAGELAAMGIRAVLCDPAGGASPGVLQRQWRQQGVPLRVFVREAPEAIRAVVVRADTREECEITAASPAAVAAALAAALAQVEHGYAARAFRYVAARVQPAVADDIRDVVRARKVAVCHLEPTEEAVRTIADWHQGEVIGFCRTDETGPCVVTGRPTRALAYVSPRT